MGVVMEGVKDVLLAIGALVVVAFGLGAFLSWRRGVRVRTAYLDHEEAALARLRARTGRPRGRGGDDERG
ncbi:MAG TPA: hypothetical protein VH208_02570 [Myxococcaceae bacterium]|jgi:hypothetical protein|nr:hypothetical protein [Myxococcaceae bacterium]